MVSSQEVVTASVESVAFWQNTGTSETEADGQAAAAFQANNCWAQDLSFTVGKVYFLGDSGNYCR